MPSLTRLTTGGVFNPPKNTTKIGHNELLHQEPLQPPLEPSCGQFLPTYPSGSIRRSHTTSKYLPGSEQDALHPFRRATPDQKGCHAYGSGALPLATSPTAGISSRHTQAAASDAATQPRNTCPAPNKTRYTRSVALHPIRRGVMPTDRVHCLSQQAQPRAFPPDTHKRQHQTQPHNLEIPARLRTRRATPVPSRYTRSEGVSCLRIGCTAPHDKHT